MQPVISVIIASYNAEKNIARCLASLKKQVTSESFEVILVDSSSDNTQAIAANEYPGIRLFGFKERKFCGDARNYGISVARGEIIAFLDADCTAENNWIEEVVKAHKSGHCAIGGSIANGEFCNYIAWAAYFCEFSQWLPMQGKKYMTDIAGASMTYKKGTFDEYGNFIEGTYCSDTEFHWRMVKNNKPLLFVPSIRIAHYSIGNFRKFVAHEFLHGRSFARIRVKHKSFGAGRQLVHALFCLALPFKFLAERGIMCMTNKRYLWKYFQALPLTVLGFACWSVGECAGYLSVPEELR